MGEALDPVRLVEVREERARPDEVVRAAEVDVPQGSWLTRPVAPKVSVQKVTVSGTISHAVTSACGQRARRYRSTLPWPHGRSRIACGVTIPAASSPRRTAWNPAARRRSTDRAATAASSGRAGNTGFQAGRRSTGVPRPGGTQRRSRLPSCTSEQVHSRSPPGSSFLAPQAAGRRGTTQSPSTVSTHRTLPGPPSPALHGDHGRHATLGMRRSVEVR